MSPWDVNWTATNCVENKTRDHIDSSVIGIWLLLKCWRMADQYYSAKWYGSPDPVFSSCWLGYFPEMPRNYYWLYFCNNSKTTSETNRKKLHGCEVLIVVQILDYELVCWNWISFLVYVDQCLLFFFLSLINLYIYNIYYNLKRNQTENSLFEQINNRYSK